MLLWLWPNCRLLEIHTERKASPHTAPRTGTGMIHCSGPASHTWASDSGPGPGEWWNNRKTWPFKWELGAASPASQSPAVFTNLFHAEIHLFRRNAQERRPKTTGDIYRVNVLIGTVAIHHGATDQTLMHDLGRQHGDGLTDVQQCLIKVSHLGAVWWSH